MRSVSNRILTFVLIAYSTFALPTQAADFNPNIFVDLAKRTVPSVVNIQTVQKGRNSFGRGMGPADDLFRKFFEDFFSRGSAAWDGPTTTTKR